MMCLHTSLRPMGTIKTGFMVMNFAAAGELHVHVHVTYSGDQYDARTLPLVGHFFWYSVASCLSGSVCGLQGRDRGFDPQLR